MISPRDIANPELAALLFPDTGDGIFAADRRKPIPVPRKRQPLRRSQGRFHD